jgi:hypothetical protein
MLAVLRALGIIVVNLFKSRRRLEAENLFLRHQLSVALRRSPPRLRLRDSDRALLVWMVRLWPDLAGLAQVVKPSTVLRWHRAGFTAYWRWKSRKRAGRPRIDREIGKATTLRSHVPPAIRVSLLVHCCMVANANVLIAVSQRVMCMAVNRPVAPPA